ncbi:hypothetical protein J6590_008750 [Homalodisca vitripennis]|nr:hypothetical protein J6590_008750 [Homalodisca vitripennis]
MESAPHPTKKAVGLSEHTRDLGMISGCQAAAPLSAPGLRGSLALSISACESPLRRTLVDGVCPQFSESGRETTQIVRGRGFDLISLFKFCLVLETPLMRCLAKDVPSRAQNFEWFSKFRNGYGRSLKTRNEPERMSFNV